MKRRCALYQVQAVHGLGFVRVGKPYNRKDFAMRLAGSILGIWEEVRVIEITKNAKGQKLIKEVWCTHALNGQVNK